MLGAELHYRTDVIVVVQTPRVLGGAVTASVITT